jgi:hypothetical protein
VVIGADWTGNCKSNYNTIMTTTAPEIIVESGIKYHKPPKNKSIDSKNFIYITYNIWIKMYKTFIIKWFYTISSI